MFSKRFYEASARAKFSKAVESWQKVGGYIANNASTILVDRWAMGSKSSYRFALVSIVNGRFHYTQYKRTKREMGEVIVSHVMVW